MTQASKPQRPRTATAADLLRGGDDALKPLLVDHMIVGGAPAVVYLRELSAKSVMDFAQANRKTRKNQSDTAGMIGMFALVQECVCNQDGEVLFAKADELHGLPMGVFQQLSTAVTDAMADANQQDESEGDEEPAGKVGSGETAPAASPTG